MRAGAGGDDFDRAQKLLRSRVEAYGDKLEGETLRILVRFGNLGGSLARSDKPILPILAAALDSFVVACRLVAFDRSLGRVDPDLPPMPQRLEVVNPSSVKHQDDLRELEKALGALEGDILQRAEWQEWSDALENARQMRKAAAYVARAREHLKQAFP